MISSLGGKITESESNERTKPSEKTVGRKFKFWVLISKCAFFTKWRIHFTQCMLLFFMMLTILFFGEFENKILTYNDVVEFKLSEYGETKAFFSVDRSNALFKNMTNIYSNLIQQELGDPNAVSNVSEAIILEGLQNIEFYKKRMIVSAEFTTRSNGHSIAKAMYSNSAVLGSTTSVTLVFNALLKSFVGSDYSISSKMNPLPNQSKSKVSHIYTMQLTALWCILLTLIMAIISGLFIIVPQIERTSNLKHLQIMSGVSRRLYWLTWYIWNILLYIFVVSFALFFVGIVNNYLNISELFTTDEMVVLFIILLVYGIAVLPYCYLYTYIKLRSKALAYFVLLNLFASQMFMLLTLYFETSNDDYLENVSKHMTHFLNLFPVFGLKSTIAKFVKKAVWNYNWDHTLIEQRESICKSRYNPCCGSDSQRCVQYQSYLSFEDASILISVLEMLASTILYVFILTAVEVKLFYKLKRYLCKSTEKENPDSKGKKVVNQDLEYGLLDEQELFDSETNLESGNVSQSRSSSHDTPNISNTQGPILQVNDLTKKFGNKEVLRRITFEVPTKNCIGLLGPNGAGKTTISRILAEEEHRDTGDVNRDNLQKNKFGYCPQSDCGSSLTNGKRVLKLFGELRGLKNVEHEVRRLINTLDLTDCADKVSSAYSGGNKRKLATALALIGNPDLILLDEPTAGVDPISRHKMRCELRSVNQTSSMIISTHIIEDCESLCNNLVVIKNGRVLEKGPILQLKNKFNQNVVVNIKINSGISQNTDTKTNRETKLIKELNDWEMIESNEVKTLKKEFCEIFTESNLEDQHASLLKYSITISSLMFNDIYQHVEKLQRRHSVIEDYEITTSTLENVYLTISKNNNS